MRKINDLEYYPDGQTIAVYLDRDEQELFHCIKNHYGLRTNSSVFRMLVVQKGRMLEHKLARQEANRETAKTL